ncbi:MAG: hypothetical protein L6R40_003676 [Gallowayella cf. fulva]|nr:MAG: hypothetical protein L6R40_003676 [Xanthomendoza cf. fulva]
MRIRFFRIFYSTTFTVLGFVLAVLLLITPANLVYEAIRGKQIYSIFIVSGVYLVTFIVAVLLYASRLYANRRALLHIPKAWSPLEKGQVEKRVRRLVAEKLDETAVVAYEARPRHLSKDDPQTQTPQNAVQPTQSAGPEIHPPALLKPPPWGPISHPGWSSPSSSDFPHLQLTPIINELSNLIEAKAVSLAPPSPLSSPIPTSTAADSAVPDALIVEYLQRPATMGLREYFAHLTASRMLTQPNLNTHFLALYEKARFSSHPISETAFRTLMALFADILRNIQPLPPSIIDQIRADNASLLYSLSDAEGIDTDTRSLQSNDTVQRTPHPEKYYTPRPDRGSLSSGSEAGSEGTVRTAPSHPTLSRRDVSMRGERSSSTKRGFRVGDDGVGLASRSQRSLRTKKSLASSLGSQRSGGSVIRLAEARTELDLPYTIVTPL